MSVEKILYILKCPGRHKTLHTAFYVNGNLHCPFCHDDYPILSVEVMEWRANCHSCQYARWAGMSESTATMFADAHVRRNPSHRVGVKREAHLAATKTLAKLSAWRLLPKS